MYAVTHTIIVGLIVGLVGGTAAHGQTGTVIGSARTTGPDRENFAIPGVKVTLTCGSQAVLRTVSDEQGQFQFANVPGGSCSLVTDVQGFKSVSTAFEITGTERIDLPLSLELEAMYSGLMVTGDPFDKALRKTRSPRRTCSAMRTGVVVKREVED